ncbi:hypothetical protein ATANTOWER_003856 [Ataeniobius toweri]|uniref:Uncharacterized protein n=1 Tax=Ataeniobius toweri TaxID=208326 RepID=A0ABU7AWN0_9TELE|nr:hypothetical protein [Ataeniobius toweri]
MALLGFLCSGAPLDVYGSDLLRICPGGQDYVLSGLWAPEITARFGVSTRTIRGRLRETSLRNADLYSSLYDEELDRMVSEVHRSHPNSGVVRNSVPLK